MAKVRDLVDQATRELVDAALAGDEEAASSLLPTRHHDMVGTWPSEKLGELIEQRPDLLPELIRRRPSEVQQA